MARSEALKKAQEKYYKEKRSKTQKTISITLTALQADEDKRRIISAGFTVAEFWRASVDKLPPLQDESAEPLPSSDDLNDNKDK